MNDLLEAGIIESTTQSYAFPVIFVKNNSTSKTNDKNKIKLQMAVDFIALNDILERDS